MTTVYKLTRPDLTTHQGFQWEVGREYTFPGTGPLCTAGWAHAYTSAALGALLNPIHANYKRYRLWEAQGVVGATDRGLKIGCSSLTLLHELAVPDITPDQRVSFALMCALEVYPAPAPEFARWAAAWLSGHDRSMSAVNAAKAATWSAARAATWSAAAANAAWSAARAATWSAAAADAARSAAWSAARAAAANAAWSAAKAATWSERAVAAENAAKAADYAAAANAAWSAKSVARLNFDTLATSALLPWGPVRLYART